MIKELVHDPIFLAGKLQVETKEALYPQRSLCMLINERRLIYV